LQDGGLAGVGFAAQQQVAVGQGDRDLGAVLVQANGDRPPQRARPGLHQGPGNRAGVGQRVGAHDDDPGVAGARGFAGDANLPRALLGPVVGHLNTVAALLQGPTRPSLRRQLCSIAGETAGLAGWLTFDLEDRRAAGAYFRAGIQAAQEADDKALGAYLVGSSCVQPAYRERPYARLRRLEGRTHGFTRGDANPTTQAWLVTLEAEATRSPETSEPPSARSTRPT
jgi:hypothetical protein